MNYGRRKLIVVMAVTSGWTFGEIDDDDEEKGQRSEVRGRRSKASCEEKSEERDGWGDVR